MMGISGRTRENRADQGDERSENGKEGKEEGTTGEGKRKALQRPRDTYKHSAMRGTCSLCPLAAHLFDGGIRDIPRIRKPLM